MRLSISLRRNGLDTVCQPSYVVRGSIWIPLRPRDFTFVHGLGAIGFVDVSSNELDRSFFSSELLDLGVVTLERLLRAFSPRVVSRIFRTFGWAERGPALAHAVMAPLICRSFSNSMFRYLLVDHAVPATWHSLAAARLSADRPSGNAATTRVRRRISRRMRSSGLLVRIRRQCSSRKA
jgi:hypothetical protein